MTRPGSETFQTTSPPTRSAPTDTGVWFIAGPTQRVSLVPQRVNTLSDYRNIFGARMPDSLIYDSLDFAFHEGLSSAYVVSVVGAAPVKAFTDLPDAEIAPRTSLRVVAKSEGEWGNDIDVAVTAGDGGAYNLTVTYGTVVERATNLRTQAEAVAWSAASALVDIALGESDRVPDTGTNDLTSGTSDLDTVDDRSYAEALARFRKDLGPGQVSIPGLTSNTGHVVIQEHCEATGRDALKDYPDTDDTTTLKAAVLADRSAPGSDKAAAFGPWLTIPGIVAGTVRRVPPCALVAGRIAAVDSFYGSANVPAAGMDDPVGGVSRYALSVTQEWTDDQFTDLSLNGFNVIKPIYGGITIFGWRSSADPDTNPEWVGFNNARLMMQLRALLDEVGMRHVFKVIDGSRIQIGKFYKDCVGVLMPFYERGDLYGETFADACFVDVDSVNTDETIARGELNANIGVKFSNFAEYVVININKVPIEGSV